MVPISLSILPYVALASLCISPASAGTSMPAEGATELRQDGAFDASSAGVFEARTVHLPGSSVKLALWKQRGADGQVTSHYAISLDGQSFAVSTATDYSIHTNRLTFDPLVHQPDFTGSLVHPGESVYIVQFVTQPLEEYRQAIVQLGGSIYDYVGNHSYVVHLPGMSRASAGELPFVRWIGRLHGEFRLDAAVLQGLNAGTLPPSARYNVVVFERGLAQKQAVADRIVAMGGSIDLLYAEGFRFEATLAPEMIAGLAGMNEVAFIDPWGAPEVDMDIAREITGANYIEPLSGFTGAGVRGEVLDVGCRTTHQEFANTPIINHGAVNLASHGTCTTAQIFASGVNPQARGMIPDGQPIAASTNSLSNRYTHTAELVDPNLVYKCVFQSNSWGDPLTTSYNSKSQEIDDIIFLNDFVICQSQSNANSQQSRPQAWGKNIVSVGGVDHENTLSKSDDNSSGASYGPAADQRIKPDLSHFYDNIFTADSGSNSDYTSSFGGTSGATPITAGSFGLLFQMWSQQTFGNPVPVPGGTVFENRPHAMTAKALMINAASAYDWTLGGPNGGLSRIRQGWGLADVRNLYDRRNDVFVVDQTEILTNLQNKLYPFVISAGEAQFRVTMVYLDPAGAPLASQHRKNDLSLKVTSPSGAVYWGNNGLSAGLWSTSGGVANVKDTVENVFVQNPAAGPWLVEVIASDVNSDAVVSTPGIDASFALVVTGGDPSSCTAPAPVGYCSSKFNSLGCLPLISGVGLPSATSGSGFTVQAVDVANNKSGILFYGVSGRASTPFQGGTLCVNSPIKRTPSVNSGGSPTGDDCTGVLAIDMNAFAVGSLGGTPLPDLQVPGTVVQCQFWGRDPGFPAPNNTTLTNGLEYTLCP